MDPRWFGLSTSKALIVSWAGNPEQSETEIEPTIDIGGHNIEHADGMTSAALKIDHISSKGKIFIKQKRYLLITDRELYLDREIIYLVANIACNWRCEMYSPQFCIQLII